MFFNSLKQKYQLRGFFLKCVNFAHLLTKVPRYATGNGYHTSYSKKKQRKRIVTKPHRYIVFKRNISLRNILLNLKKKLFLSYTSKIQIKLAWLYKNKRILKANFIAFWNNLLWKITTLFVMFKKKKKIEAKIFVWPTIK